MQARIIQVLGGISFFLGILFLFNASGVITGFAIAESIAPSISSIISLVLIVAGIGLVSYGELIAHGTRESRLRQIVGKEKYEHLSDDERQTFLKSYRRHLEAEEKRGYGERSGDSYRHENSPHVIRTKHFEREIKKYDEGPIRKAIEKIGTGLGKEEKLSHLNGRSIRVSNGARIIFEREEDGTIKLKDYLTDHKYSKSYKTSR